MPVQMRTKMIYVSDKPYSLVSSVASPGVLAFSANGLFDPDITGTGHQPRGFDQLMLFYDHYVVTKAKITVRLQNNLSGNPALAFVTVRDTSLKSSNYLDYLESSLTKTVQLGVESSASSSKVIEYSVSIGEFLGRRDPLSDPQLKGDVSANPLEGCFFHIGALSMDQFTASSVRIIATIEYTLNLIEPKIVQAS